MVNLPKRLFLEISLSAWYYLKFIKELSTGQIWNEKKEITIAYRNALGAIKRFAHLNNLEYAPSNILQLMIYLDEFIKDHKIEDEFFLYLMNPYRITIFYYIISEEEQFRYSGEYRWVPFTYLRKNLSSIKGLHKHPDLYLYIKKFEKENMLLIGEHEGKKEVTIPITVRSNLLATALGYILQRVIIPGRKKLGPTYGLSFIARLKDHLFRPSGSGVIP
jgi:hypothetical protein